MPLWYRLTDTTDPEERLEDAALWKAMHDAFGDGITAVPSSHKGGLPGLMFGRSRRGEFGEGALAGPDIPYWRDPAFLGGIKRRMELCDLDRACEIVDQIHAWGRDAFVKATEAKLMVARVPQGTSLPKALGDMVYSFIDKPACLLVQEHVEMTCERRFCVINRCIVSDSPVAFHLTPLSALPLERSFGEDMSNIHFRTPRDQTGFVAGDIHPPMKTLVRKVAATMQWDHAIIDVALVDGEPELIEFNPMQPGMFGLYAMDPNAIATACWGVLSPDLRSEVEGQRMSGTPVQVPGAAPERRWKLVDPQDAAHDNEAWEDFSP